MQQFINSKQEIRESLNDTMGWFYTVTKTLYEGNTEFQHIELLESDYFGKILRLDGITQVMEHIEYEYHEPIVHIPLLSHPNPKRVLIIGGGDGTSLHEVLRYSSIEYVDFVEIDKGVVDFSRLHLQSLNNKAFDDRRVCAHFMDGRAFVESTHNTYDIIIMDMTDPNTLSAKLYTKEFFSIIQKLFYDDNSLFIMHTVSPEISPKIFAYLHDTLNSVFPLVHTAYKFIRMYGSLWSFAIMSQSNNPLMISKDVLSQRISERNIQNLQLISPETWLSFFNEFPYITKILSNNKFILTDTSIYDVLEK